MIAPSVLSRLATLGLSQEQADVVSLMLADVEKATTAEFVGPFAATRWRAPSAQAEHWLRALWQAYVEAADKAQRTQDLADALAARERWQVFLVAQAPPDPPPGSPLARARAA